MNLRLQTKVLGALAGVLLVMLAIGGWSAWLLGRQSEALVRLVTSQAATLGSQAVGAAERSAAEMTQLIWLVALLPSLVTIIGFSAAFALARIMIRTVEDTSSAARQIATTDLPAFVTAMQALSDGDLTRRVTVTTKPLTVSSDDEFGQMARALNDLVAGLNTAGQAFSETNDGLHALVGRVQFESERLTDVARQSVDSVSQTRAVATQVTHSITNIASGARETSQSVLATNAAVAQLGQGVGGVAQGASAQAAQLQTMAQTVTQMASDVDQMADNATRVNDVSRGVLQAAEAGERSVGETIHDIDAIRDVVRGVAGRIETLGTLGQRIGAVVETIDDIAAQTNLLALNAAIEAARAGEHGRGFAIVADEVRKLAERSQRETKAIGELIREVQTSTEQAVSAMGDGTRRVEQSAQKADAAGAALQEIMHAVTTVVEQISGMAGATQQMTARVHQVVTTMEAVGAIAEANCTSTARMAAHSGEVTASSESIAAIVRESGRATAEVSSAAEQLSAQVSEMAAQAEALVVTAERLHNLTARFRTDPSRAREGAVSSVSSGQPSVMTPRRRRSDWVRPVR